MDSRRLLVLASLFAIPALVGCASSETLENVDVARSILGRAFTAGDFQPLFDRLADDVVLNVASSDGARAHRELRGKRNVMAFFLSEGVAAGSASAKSPEYFADGERVVVTLSGRGQAAIVDFRDGRIIRYLVIREAPAARGWIRSSQRPASQ